MFIELINKGAPSLQKLRIKASCVLGPKLGEDSAETGGSKAHQ